MNNIVVGLANAKPAPDGSKPKSDSQPRCEWGASTIDYAQYHDNEWGVPTGDDVEVFERLCLEGFQAGLSWLTVLRKRSRFREVFEGFNPETVAQYTSDDIERLLGDPGIIRHRGKIEATINNAKLVAEMRANGESIAGLIWAHERSQRTTPTSFADVPSQTDESKALSKTLRRRGFKFVGPTTVYAAMQAIGVANDHLDQCWVQASREDLLDDFVRPKFIR